MPLGVPQAQEQPREDMESVYLFTNSNVFRFKLWGLRVVHVNAFLFVCHYNSEWV